MSFFCPTPLTHTHTHLMRWIGKLLLLWLWLDGRNNHEFTHIQLPVRKITHVWYRRIPLFSGFFLHYFFVGCFCFSHRTPIYGHVQTIQIKYLPLVTNSLSDSSRRAYGLLAVQRKLSNKLVLGMKRSVILYESKRHLFIILSYSVKAGG